MTDRPMLFSAPMVRALLDGRKTQTRRPLKLPTKGEYVRPDMGGWAASTVGGPGAYLDRAMTVPAPERPCVWNQITGTVIVPSFQPSDRLWVREALERANGECVGYPADHTWLPNTPWLWRRESVPSIHMPRWASRLTLIVTDVRVHRLREISRDDAIAEGLRLASSQIEEFWRWPEPLHERLWLSPVAAFRDLWDSLNAERGFGWDANPWVVALTFTVAQRNIDALEAA